MKPIAIIDRISGKPKLTDGFSVVQTPYDIPLYTHEWDINKVSIAFWHDDFVEVKNPQTGDIHRFELIKAQEK